MASEDTKRKLISIADKMLLEKGFENISARAIAKEAGCSATVIYKHFENLNYLLTLASFSELEKYNKDNMWVDRAIANPILSDELSWEVFCRHAFRNVPIYVNLFWGEGAKYFEEASVEYFQLFPDQWKNENSATYYSAYFSPSISERELVLLRMAANQGYITIEDAMYLSEINAKIAFASLMEHMEDYKDQSIANKAAEKCYSLILRNFEKCLLKSID